MKLSKTQHITGDINRDTFQPQIRLSYNNPDSSAEISIDIHVEFLMDYEKLTGQKLIPNINKFLDNDLNMFPSAYSIHGSLLQSLQIITEDENNDTVVKRKLMDCITFNVLTETDIDLS